METKHLDDLPVNPYEYHRLCTRTESLSMAAMTERLRNEETIRFLHASMGMVTEAAELLDMLKKHIFYGKPFDAVNAAEEIGDSCWYAGIACDVLGTTMPAIFTQNIQKLKTRYPEKFTEERAIHRDLTAERATLEGFVPQPLKEPPADAFGRTACPFAFCPEPPPQTLCQEICRYTVEPPIGDAVARGMAEQTDRAVNSEPLDAMGDGPFSAGVENIRDPDPTGEIGRWRHLNHTNAEILKSARPLDPFATKFDATGERLRADSFAAEAAEFDAAGRVVGDSQQPDPRATSVEPRKTPDFERSPGYAPRTEPDLRTFADTPPNPAAQSAYIITKKVKGVQFFLGIANRGHFWTEDSTLAIRFARQCDAQAFKTSLQVADTLGIADEGLVTAERHTWIG